MFYIFLMKTVIKDQVSEWMASSYENSPRGALAFMKHNRQFTNLRSRGIHIKNLAFTLWSYRNSIADITPGELKALSKLQGIPVDPEKLEYAKQKLKSNIQMTIACTSFN